MLDNEAFIWNAYSIHHWPTRCLIDRDGYLRYIQHGEGGYVEFERAIQQLLMEAGFMGNYLLLHYPYALKIKKVLHVIVQPKNFILVIFAGHL